MKSNIQRLSVILLISVAVLGLSFNLAYADSNQVDRNKEYKNLIQSTDGAIRSIRLNGEITENKLLSLENRYDSVFPNVDSELSNDIESILDSNPSNLQVDNIRNLRKMIVNLGESEEIELPFVYKHAIFVILGITFGLGFVVNMISRTVVDWESVNRVKRKQSEIKDNLKEAKKKGDKKEVHKLQKKQQNFMQEHMSTMFSPMKTMLIIIIPFIIVFSLLRSTYSGWVVAWLPFNFPWPKIGLPLLNRFFKGTMAGLGFFGWYLLSYFGFSQIWRKLLVPSE